MSDQPAKPDTAMMRRLAMTVVAGAASLLCAAAVQAGQLLVAAANSQGDAIFELTRATSGTASSSCEPGVSANRRFSFLASAGWIGGRLT